MTGFFQVYKTMNVQWDIIQVVRETKQISLNDFLKQYNSWTFVKITLEDEILLKGYQNLGTWDSVSFMTIKKTLTEQYVNVYETKKPLGTSLKDLWISLTWPVIVDVKFNEKTWRSSLLQDVWPLLIFFVILVLIFKFAMPKGGAWGFPFSVKAGKLNTAKNMKTKFSDVAGMDEVKMELSEIVDYLKNPLKYQKVGARHPKWVLLYGQPGSGKTLLARAVAWESNVPFFSVSGSEFMEMLVGMWAAKVRELFGKAKAVGRAIIFIDEIDAIGKKRGVWSTWGHQEQEQTLNQILTEMDGFDNTTNVIVIAATNRPDILDPALMRAGRFDRKVYVSEPTYDERLLIFDYYLKGKKLAPSINIPSLAKRTSGLVGADIENIVNEAALKEAKENRTILDQNDFEYALEKVIMWPEKKVKSMREEEKKIIAFHELGHAVTSHILPHADPVEKISIVRRWHALWVTWIMPNEDLYLASKVKFLDEVISLLWWRAAEEVFFGSDNITTWASNDFEKATDIITNMIVKYGMDKDLGTVAYVENNKNEYSMFRWYSEKTAQIIDEKIKKYMAHCYEQSKQLIIKNKLLIEKLSIVLLDKEYLSKDEFESMIKDFSKSKKIVIKKTIKQ
jgi:cell division protease FtsH